MKNLTIHFWTMFLLSLPLALSAGGISTVIDKTER